MRVHVLWFGRASASPYEGQVETYRERVAQRWPASDRALRPASGGRGADPARALRAEAEAVRRHLPQGWHVVALDEAGDSLTSERFAAMLAEAEERAVPGVAFLIGSDLGLDSGLLATANRRLSLGPMTLPHLLARLLLWEQLFRATHILGGGGYHRHRVQ